MYCSVENSVDKFAVNDVDSITDVRSGIPEYKDASKQCLKRLQHLASAERELSEILFLSGICMLLRQDPRTGRAAHRAPGWQLLLHSARRGRTASTIPPVAQREADVRSLSVAHLTPRAASPPTCVASAAFAYKSSDLCRLVAPPGRYVAAAFGKADGALFGNATALPTQHTTYYQVLYISPVYSK